MGAWHRLPSAFFGPVTGGAGKLDVRRDVHAPKEAAPAAIVQSEQSGQEQAAWVYDLRIHDLRHSAASFMINAGIDLFAVGKVMGHANYKSTTHYSPLANETLLSAVEAGAAKMMDLLSHCISNLGPLRGHPKKRRQGLAFGSRTVVDFDFRPKTNYAVAGLNARENRRGGRRRIRHLSIVGVGFDQCRVGKFIHRWHKGLPICSLPLSLIYATGGKGADAHAIPDENDDVASWPHHWAVSLEPCELRCTPRR